MNEQDCVEQADGFVNGVETFDVGEQPSEPPVHREEDEPRLRRIADYEAVALAKENPFEAVMQATSAGLMRIELRVAEGHRTGHEDGAGDSRADPDAGPDVRFTPEVCTPD